MRELEFKDVYYLSNILDKLDVDLDLNKIMDTAKKTPDAQAYLGGQLTLTLLKKAHKAQKEINSWLADLSGKSVEEIDKLKIKEIKELFVELGKLDGLGDLFQSASEEQSS